MKNCLIIVLLVIAFYSKSQQVTADFTYTVNSFGQVNFTSTSINVGTNLHKWIFGDGNIGGNLSAISHTYAAPGSYNVIIIIESSQGVVRDSTTKKVVVPALTSIEAIDQSSIEIYPNPCNEKIILGLNGPKQVTGIRITNYSGQLVSEYTALNWQGHTFEISTSRLSPAMYFIIMQYEDGSTGAKKFFKVTD